MTKKSNSMLAKTLRVRKIFKEKRHWYQGWWKGTQSKHTCYCFGGAIKASRVEPEKFGTPISEKEAKIYNFQSVHAMVAWNDDPKRTIKDIRDRAALGVKNARKQSQAEKSK